ncbi:GDSL esterase/lipase [Artemisia annua]|uniref:GDSL esterase/lipase n=1 Tax=Artemisia annua TaxID=35608 RepID=A0A2U1M3W1_ARTAN|nr:GDSL esterase/lipase [Artemisia annua]
MLDRAAFDVLIKAMIRQGMVKSASHIIFSNIEPVASVHVSGDLCTKSRNSSLSSPRRGPAAALAPVPALFVIGDSSVDCGTNNFLGTLARADHAPYGRDFDTHQPTGRFSNGRIPVDYLALHLKLPFIPSYLGQSGSTEDMKQGLNYASAGAGIIFSSGSELGQHISFTQQIEQVMDTFQRFTLTMGETEAANLISDSVFYISIGTNDYIHYYLPDVSSVQSKYVSWNFTKFLARTMKEEIKVKSYLGQSGSTEDMKQGLNYASAGAGIIFSSGSELGQHISFTQQIEQVMDTFQRFTLTMGETEAANLISDSVFYISIGTNDYIHYYLPDVSSVQSKYVSWNFTKFLARTMKEEIKVKSYLGQNGSTEDMKQGLNYASAGAGIIFSSGSELGQHISFTQQIEQVMDTFQRFTLTMGETEAANLISDSVFYISIGTNDYIHYYLPDVSSVQSKYVSWNFTKFLARTMKEEIKVKSSDNEFWVERICVVAAVCLPVLIRFVYFKIRPLLKSLPDTKGSSWVEEIFKKVAEDGAKFCGCTTLALIGVGHGAKLLESSPTSTAYIGLLSIAGFFGFSFAQLASPGWIFRSFSVFGFIAHTAIIVICSLHRTVRNEYEFLIVLGSVLYVLLCVWGKWMLVTNTIEANAKAKAQLEATTTTEDEAVKEGDAKALEDEEKRLNQIAKDGVAFTTLGGLALFCVGEWGAFVESFPIAFTLLATYNVMTFSCLYAARFLERGIFFDILLLVGSVFGMMMIPTSVGLLLLPGYDFPIMLLTILSVTLVKWDRIDAAIEWVLDRCS